MAVTVDDVRLRVETDLEDGPLQRILDSAVAAINRAAGSASSQVQTFSALGAAYVVLRRRHASIASIAERGNIYTSSATTLSADDYREVGDYKLLRLATGTNPRSTWGAEVVVTYVPEVDADIRDRVALDVVQMDVEFKAVDEEEVGDYKSTQKDYRKRRRALIAQVREGRSPLL